MTATAPMPARRERFAALGSRVFDLLVIGGGITGCGIARDAALRGLTVALVEQDDFASGTSSRSSRLIHGGVRYLEHGQLHLVFEASTERRRLLRLAPHLVRPLEFTWPVYEQARLPAWKVNAGLTAYDLLALFRNVGRHRRLSAADVLEREPMLGHDGLLSGASYFDATTNDARLTIANAIGASEAGAIVANHARVTAFVDTAGKITGARVIDTVENMHADVRATTVVNATGPWSDAVRHLGGRITADAAERTVRGSKGAHIAVPRSRVGNRGALTLLSPIDGRVVFVLPDEMRSIIGTTDTYTDEQADAVRASRQDVQYLLEAANTFFPAAELKPDDVISAWAGIRPLSPAAGAEPDAASREHEIHVDDDGLITISGGKLTTYRKMGAQIVDRVNATLGRRAKSRTTRIPLPGAEHGDIDREIADATAVLRDAAFAEHLVHWYGTRWRAVLAAGADHANGRWTRDDVALAQGQYAVLHEQAMTLADVLIRRTGISFTSRDHGADLAQRMAPRIARSLAWTAADARTAIERFNQDIERVFSIAD